jgi:2-keto-4-pentenoate hydratase/2-oxohepta-3-ene-1,7-dioic acid hydratase in catechol pathway
MVHSVDALISALSKIEDLSEGDLIFTGTPAGVGPLSAGDKVSAWLKDESNNILSRFDGIC